MIDLAKESDHPDRFRYDRKLSDENAEIADWPERLTTAQKTWGFGLCFLYLRNIKGFGWNHKRVYLPDLPGTGVEPSDQAEEKACEGKARAPGCTR